ncbi:ABC-F family ATP-binding cassette domain-containing protein [Kiloniella sp. EL199]|uniref:ABC-F family ATP-binding cassette domain-containing protein n=1 Tax=Kiloniella sp. EL199 TaxID=2107581 RepID=UPI000EA0F12C|nr:ABC-F family ATP-binding cassette domain-containing protein [Kiloniella sp. EL199]
MTLLNAKDLGITLGMPLFTNLNFSINKGDHIGLVAANGRGKSTLLSCLAGGMEPTEGDITRARGLKVGYVEQNVPGDLMEQSLYDAVLSALPAEQAEYESWRVDVVLDDLAVPIELHSRLVCELSGGWQRVMLLARVWVGEPDLLLMDEPTNHLDLSRIGFLQNWLGTVARDTPIFVASHDRAFLDAVTNRTLFLREDQSQSFALSYSQARAALDESDATKERQFENDARKAQQLRRQAAKLKNIGINSGSDLLVTKTKQLKERADKIEQQSQAAYKDKSAGAIKLVNSDTHAKALITLEEGGVTAPDGKVLFKIPPLWIKRGDRIVLLGRNGTGKTQLIRMVQQAVMGEHSTIKSTPSVIMGYSDQALSQLDDRATPTEVITERFDVGDQRAIALLAGAGINLDMQSKPIGALSGGQKSRLAMLDLRLRNPNFYLLDEPTNHLDIEGQEALEEELQAHNASCLLVSHDRAFVRNTGTRYWLIENKRLKEVEDPEDFFAASLGELLSA